MPRAYDLICVHARSALTGVHATLAIINRTNLGRVGRPGILVGWPSPEGDPLDFCRCCPWPFPERLYPVVVSPKSGWDQQGENGGR